MVEDQIVNHHHRHQRINKGERTGNGRRQFLYRAIKAIHDPGMDDAEDQQIAPGKLAVNSGACTSGSIIDADENLNEGDMLRGSGCSCAR